MAKHAQKTVAETSNENQETKGEVTTRDLSKFNKDELKKEYGTWSGVFRALQADGLTKGEISKVTGKRYQHVRNVLITPIAKAQG
jgi:hypothetical protein